MEQKRIIRCVVACLDSQGEPALVPVRVATTANQYEEGWHFDTAEEAADEQGYDSTSVVFDELSGTQAKRVMDLFDWIGDSEIPTADCDKVVEWVEDCADSAWHVLPKS